MNSQHVRVTTGQSVFGIVLSFAFKVLLIALELIVGAIKIAIVVAGWLWVNVVVPGARAVGRLCVRLATRVAAWAASRRLVP